MIENRNLRRMNMSISVRRLLPLLLCLLLFLGLSSPASAEETPVQVNFLCDDGALLSYLTVYDADGLLCSPVGDGVYALTPGDYHYRFHDTNGGYEDMEADFSVESGYSALFFPLAPVPATEYVSFTWINPVYADVLDASDIPAPPVEQADMRLRGSARFLRDSGTIYTDTASAARDLKSQIMEYEDTATIRLYVSGQTTASEWRALAKQLFDMAIAHNGTPTEGDYLRYEYGGYTAGGKLGYETDKNRSLCTFDYSLKHYVTAAQEDALAPVAADILAGLSLEGKSDYEKLLAIYAYLCDNTTYGGSGDVKYTAYGALVDHLAVCQGYSAAFYRLCLASGVDARIITATSMTHAWNIAALDGVYYEMDCTWDTGYSPENYRYLLRGTDYWLSNHLYNGTSVIGDEFNDAAFAAAYPLPAEDYAFNISFDANGGSDAPAAQSKRPCKPLLLTTDVPTRADATLAGYKLTLNANGGSVTPASLTAARSRSYSFLEWRTGADGSGTAYKPGASCDRDENLTLYARWSSTNTTKSVTLPTPTREGYSFKGWAANRNAESGSTGDYTPTGSMTLYAVWEPNTYTVSFETDGGSDVQAQTVAWGETAKQPDTPRKDGFWFAGWYLDGKVFDFSTPIKENVTLRATWAAPDLTLPAALTELGEEAFVGGMFRFALLPAGAASIGARAFADCPALNYVYIPESVTAIADDAFDTASGLTIFGKSGSAAETYAKAHGFAFITPD